MHEVVGLIALCVLKILVSVGFNLVRFDHLRREGKESLSIEMIIMTKDKTRKCF